MWGLINRTQRDFGHQLNMAPFFASQKRMIGILDEAEAAAAPRVATPTTDNDLVSFSEAELDDLVTK